MNYYNENDPKAVAWLKNLIKAKLIPKGVVDDRSIVDVTADDLKDFTQCHFFAGIGGWSYALQLAGWPTTRPVWTGSCPCQPFSIAGKQTAEADQRHLWPYFQALINERKPSIVFGEQVASKLGRSWLSGIFFDLEEMGYAAAGADLCAAGIGAPHIRQRLYWLAYSQQQGLEGHTGHGNHQHKQRREQTQSPRPAPACGSTSNQWGEFDAIRFKDGKTRRIQSGCCTLANGLPARMVRLRGYGNAIVPPLAAEFIRSSVESLTSF